MSEPTPRERPELIRAVPVRHPGRWVAIAAIAVVVAMVVNSLLTNKRFQWDVVGEYVFHDSIMTGVRGTLVLTALAMLIGVAGGIVIAVMRLSPNPVVSGIAWVYVWVFRGTPIVVQLVFWFYLAALYPELSIGIPFGPEFTTGATNDLITPFVAVLLGLGLNEAAYMSEIVRAGLVSVDEGQTEAAQALGMSRLLTLRRIVLPQAMRVIVPPTGNELISMLKTTSLVVVVGYTELFTITQRIYSRTFQQIPLLVVAVLWYLFLTSILQIAQYYVERHYAKGSSHSLPPTPWQRAQQVWGRFGLGHARVGGGSA